MLGCQHRSFQLSLRMAVKCKVLTLILLRQMYTDVIVEIASQVADESFRDGFILHKTNTACIRVWCPSCHSHFVLRQINSRKCPNAHDPGLTAPAAFFLFCFGERIFLHRWHGQWPIPNVSFMHIRREDFFNFSANYWDGPLWVTFLNENLNLLVHVNEVLGRESWSSTYIQINCEL